MQTVPIITNNSATTTKVVVATTVAVAVVVHAVVPGLPWAAAFVLGAIVSPTDTVAERLRVYARDTSPLVIFYGAQGKLVGIDATGPVEDVTVRAIDALRSYGG